MSFSRGIGPWLVAILVPLAMAMAQGTATSDSSQSHSAASMPPMAAGGHMMSGQMMGSNDAQDLLRKLKDNLEGLQNESDTTLIHTRIAQELALISQLQTALDNQCGMSMGQMGSHMQSGMMMGGPMSGSHMSHHGSAGATPQQRNQN